MATPPPTIVLRDPLLARMFLAGTGLLLFSLGPIAVNDHLAGREGIGTVLMVVPLSVSGLLFTIATSRARLEVDHISSEVVVVLLRRRVVPLADVSDIRPGHRGAPYLGLRPGVKVGGREVLPISAGVGIGGRSIEDVADLLGVPVVHGPTKLLPAWVRLPRGRYWPW